MENNQGWIAIHRKLRDHPFWRERRKFSKAEAWLDILMSARWSEEPEKLVYGNHVIECKRGQVCYSLSTWAERWQWSRSAVHRFFKVGTAMGHITTENVQNAVRLTVVNYESYQSERNLSETQVKRKWNGNERKADVAQDLQRPKKDKKVKKQPVVIPENLKTPEFKAAWADWLEHLKQKHKNPTSLAKQRQLKKCEKMGSAAAVKMIERSITANWQGLFADEGASHGQRSAEGDAGKPLFGGKPSGLKFPRGEKFIAERSSE